MSEYDIHSDDPMEMIRAVREKIYEETKEMTNEEFGAVLREASESYRLKAASIRLEDFDFPFLNRASGSK